MKGRQNQVLLHALAEVAGAVGGESVVPWCRDGDDAHAADDDAPFPRGAGLASEPLS